MDASRSPATSVRHEYQRGGLTQQQAGSDPILLLEQWIEEAARGDLSFEPSSACLATVGPTGNPSARMVIVRRIDHDRGALCFYTNHHSRKAEEITQHAVAALNFFWGEMERQVRVIGRVEQLTRADSEAYFATRPEGSQVSAWQSGNQSSPVRSRSALENDEVTVPRDQETGQVLCPPFWGGFAVIADELEFWAGRPSRLHDRVAFLRAGSPAASSALAKTTDKDVWNQVADERGIGWLRARLRP